MFLFYRTEILATPLLYESKFQIILQYLSRSVLKRWKPNLKFRVFQLHYKYFKLLSYWPSL